MAVSRADAKRARWLEVLAAYKRQGGPPDARGMWCPELDAASRDEIRAIQNGKLAALTPFLYENSAFYRRRFDRLGLAPTDIRTPEDLPHAARCGSRPRCWPRARCPRPSSRRSASRTS